MKFYFKKTFWVEFTMVAALLLPALFAVSVRAEIKLPPDADECVRWAAGDVRAALQAAKAEPENANIDVIIAPAAKSGIDEQSFTIDRTGISVTIKAGGAVGAMYGLQELAEQIGSEGKHGTWSRLVQGIKSTTEKPFVEIRADNMFIHVYPLELNQLDMWRAYIDMLARNRFNLLDLHGAYDLRSTSFPNFYPMLVHVADYPNIGNEQEQVRNLASFKAIIAYAKSRGVKVAFMNYSSNDGKGGAEKNAPSTTGVPPEKLADYTSKAVTLLIHELPDLYMLGFRVGESGQDAAFYKNAYIKGVTDAGRADLRLYTRSWQTTKDQLEPIAQVARAGFDIEIKYNGEQLGLPYQAMQGSNFGSYSYQGYLDVPADYQIIWQVRANGTHRFWAWENTEFIRRTVRTFTLGNARGFTLEPPNAYFSTDPADYYRSTGDKAVHQYMWQKYWMWYYAWGRLSFNPELPEENLVHAYEYHYGKAGRAVYETMQKAGKIVPLVYAYRFVGPDQHDFSPETETGNALGKRKKNVSALLQFMDNHPMDERSFAGIGAFVDDQLASRPDGRIGPDIVASRLHEVADATRKLAASVPALKGTASDEWRLLKPDLLSASRLGDYYANRIRGLTYFDYALKTGRETEYKTALDLLDKSEASWKKLGETADAIYGPLSNPLRRQTNFQWSAQLESIEKLDATAPQLWANHAVVTNAPPLKFTAADKGDDSRLRVERIGHKISDAKDQVTISCQASARKGIAKVVLWFKPLPSELPWQNADLTRLQDGSYSVTIPLAHEGLMYLVEAQDKTGKAENLPRVFDQTPYYIIPAF